MLFDKTFYPNNRTLTLSWAPWLSIVDCDDQLTYCQTEGLLPELFSIVESLYNFTLVATKEPDNFWGTVPVRGSYFDSDAEFGGVMGGVIVGDHDMSVSAWSHNIERFSWCDFSMRCKSSTENSVRTSIVVFNIIQSSVLFRAVW